MLLPSALSCEATHHIAPRPRLQSAALFTSPPTSPPLTNSSTLFATCRALQSMLSSPPAQLPTPPMLHAPTPTSVKLRLRSRKAAPSDLDSSNGATHTPRKRITKRAVPPRGINKRRRDVDNDAECDEAEGDDLIEGPADESLPAFVEIEAGPSTPKRARLAPSILPLGLERSDFTSLQHHPASPPTSDNPTTDDDIGVNWSSEEDRLLVEMVLEKLKLSKSDWQDCARSLGKDSGSVGRRWKTLMGSGEVGLKRSGGRRGKIHSTWR